MNNKRKIKYQGGGSKSRKFKWLVKVGVSKGVNPGFKIARDGMRGNGRSLKSGRVLTQNYSFKVYPCSKTLLQYRQHIR